MSSERVQRTLALLALGAWAAGCALLAPAAEEHTPHELPFNHELHVGEMEVDCADCHGPAESPTMPKLEACFECHDEEDDEDAGEYIAALKLKRPAEAPFIAYTDALGGEIIPAHDTHAAKGVDCASCHGEVGAMKATSPAVVAPMATCTGCHEERAPERLDCATCHVTIRKDTPPANHAREWEREHGKQARFGGIDPLMTGTCSYCHQRDTCLECHRQVQPQSHNRFFVVRGHGLVAANDRQACAACHQPDMCIRCHEETRPASHNASWGGTAARHCQNCHLPSQSQAGCTLCHNGTPSHAYATPMPASHTPGMECRQCHGRGQPLPHVDNGMECAACHR